MKGDNIHDDEFLLTPDFGLSYIDRAIVDAYRGRFDQPDNPSPLTGNRKRAYMAYHPRASERTAEKRASELFKRPEVVAYIDAMSADVTSETNTSAMALLQETMRHLRVCQGRIRRPQTVLIDGKAEDVDIATYDIPGVAKALDLWGRNVHVNGFKEHVDVSGQLDLADLMTRRQQQIEKRATGFDKAVSDVE